jgi:xanthine dehydrogenase accessory factor
MSHSLKQPVIAIKGAGEMATAVACTLVHAGLCHIFMLEVETPMAVRRRVSFCEAVYEKSITVEGVQAKKVGNVNEIQAAWDDSCIPLLVDPKWDSIKQRCPDVVVDAIIAKRNLGTYKGQAPLVIGLGPGFEAGHDVDIVIETLRGPSLGKIIARGCSAPNTGVPGAIGGFTRERLLKAPCAGIFTTALTLGARVKKNDVIGQVDNQPVTAGIDGILRGLLRNNSQVRKPFKVGDIDPWGNKAALDVISTKARTIGKGVLAAVLGRNTN